MKKIRLLYFAASYPDYTKIGKVPSVIFYGTEQFREDPIFDFDVCWKRNKILQFIFLPFERYLIRRTGVGFRFDQAIRHLCTLRHHDVILAETDSLGLPLLFLKRLHLIKGRVGFMSAGLINTLESQRSTILFRWYVWLLHAADFIVCWSPLEERMFKEITKASAYFILLEADVDFYKPDHSVTLDDYILCVGNDVGRDFETLFRAVESLSIPVKIVTKATRIKGLTIPKNVELHLEYVDYPTLLDWYKKARLVIVNLQEIHRFSGQRALLEAFAMGKAVIAAKTDALLSTYLLDENKNIIFYQPGNEDDLKNKILSLYENNSKISVLGTQVRIFVETLPKKSFFRTLKTLILSF